MTKAYRLTKARHANEAFSGDGARLFGGRWNRRGTSVIYVSESLALAALELFVHLGPDDNGIAFIYFEVTWPDDVSLEVVKPEALPPDWRDEPAPESTKAIGSEWVDEKRTAVLSVPSVIVPIERNYLLNPADADFSRLHIIGPETFSYNPRLWKG